MRKLLLSFLLLFLAACGKNESVTSTNPYPPPQGPVTQAPPYNNGGGYYPPQYGGGGFNPQMPQGMPPQYMPWLPIDNYFRQQPQIQQIWVNVWVNWNSYAQNNGCDRYDFNRFWLDFCPQYLQGTSYAPIYDYFNTNYYSWVNYDTQFGYCDDPGFFWQNYVGYQYPTSDYCDYCY